MSDRNRNTLISAPRRWFALIGVDFYMPGKSRRDENGAPIFFPSLRGCVYDVTKVHRYIKSQFAANSQITTLTSTQPKDGACKPIEEDEACWPTYKNIVGLLEEITGKAHKGDLVYIHYSGHGARVKTQLRDNKEELHKAIVPLDIACGGKYLFDFEITSLLDKMVKMGLTVTVVLDCCHSGSAGRGLSDFRGISQIDATESAQINAGESDVHRETATPVPQDPPNPTEFHEPNAGRGRTANPWNPQGYELLAACRVNEKAYERCYENGLWHGVLTYNLLDSLETGDANLTHGMLHRRLVARVNECSNNQTPVFMGDSQRYFFSSERLDHQYIPTITVKRLDKGYLILDVGAAQGVLVGSELAIYPWDTSDFSDSNRCSTVRATDVYPLEAKAELMGQPAENRQIEAGFQAIPIKTLVRGLAVRFLRHLNGTEENKFNQLEKAIESGNKQCRLAPFVNVVSGLEESVDYHIGVRNYQYKLLNTANNPIGHFPSSTDPEPFLRNIWHLARFEMCRNLKNLNVPEYLNKFSFTLEADELVPSTKTRYHMEAGTPHVYLQFKNKSSVPLNLTIFNFQPSWGIEKFYPREMDYDTVEVGGCVSEEVELYVPESWNPEWSDPVDCFKAFITVQATSFGCLELLKLGDDCTAPKGDSTHANSDLEMLLDELDEVDKLDKSDELDTANAHGRHVRPVQSSRGGWVTAEIEVCVYNNDSADEFHDCEEF